MPKYSIGLDFGTLSGRAVLNDNQTGEEIGSSVMEYSHCELKQNCQTEYNCLQIILSNILRII